MKTLGFVSLLLAAAPLAAGETTAAGESHSVVLAPDRTVWSWGDNSRQQLGTDARPPLPFRPSPARVRGVTGIVAVEAGGNFTLALAGDGAVWAWGANDTGQLGNGELGDSAMPVRVGTPPGIIAISAGTRHGLALRNDGSVWSWGDNSHGQLGDGTRTTRTRPVPVSDLNLMTIVGAGDHSLAVKVDGTVWAWGRNDRGQLGDGTRTDRREPVQVQDLRGVVSIAGGLSHTVAVASDGSVWTWGANDHGQLGQRRRTDRREPTVVGGLPPIATVSARANHTLALARDGSAWGWGANESGQLSVPAATAVFRPAAMTSLPLLASLSAGGGHGVGVTPDGVVWTWGANETGQLGSGRAGQPSSALAITDTGYAFADELAIGEPVPVAQEARLATRMALTPVAWTDLDGVTASGSSLTKISAGVFAAGAISDQSLGYGDGYVEVVYGGVGSTRVFGLSHGNSQSGWTDVDYGAHLTSAGILAIYEFGQVPAQASSSLAVGDVVRVEVEGGVVKYKKNGGVVYTSGVAPRYPLLVDAAIQDPGGVLEAASIAGNWTAAGQQPVTWREPDGVAVSGSALVKTAPSGWANAGAISEQVLLGDGYAELTIVDTATQRIFGLSHGNSDTNWTDPDFGVLITNQGYVAIYEAGAQPPTIPWHWYSPGDVVRVEVSAGVVVYKMNGQVFYTSTSSPTLPLLVDTSIYEQDAVLEGAALGGAWTSDGSPVEWMDLNGATPGPGGALTKTADTGWVNGGAAASKQALYAGDGYLEVLTDSNSTNRVVGLSYGNSNTAFSDIDFGIHLGPAGQFVVLQAGAAPSGAQYAPYAPGDVFRVEVQGGAVEYKRNGRLFYTSTLPPRYPLLVDVAIEEQNAGLAGAIVSGSWTGAGQPVVWTGLAGMTAEGNSLEKTSPDGWNAGAISAQQLSSGDGAVELVAGQDDKIRIFGLSYGNPGTSWEEIDFGILLQAAGEPLYVFENGVLQGGFVHYSANDVLGVAVEGGVVKYKKNGVTFHESSTTPQYPLIADTAFFTTLGRLEEATVSGPNWSVVPQVTTGTPVIWTEKVGVSVTGSSVTKTAAAGWTNGGAASEQGLAEGDGYVEVVAGFSEKIRIFGLAFGNTDTDWTDINYGIYLRTTSEPIIVHESGVFKGGFVYYAPEDVLRVEVEGGVVKYKKNGVVFYESAQPPQYPLLADTGFFDQGAELKDAAMSGSLVSLVLAPPQFSPGGGNYAFAPNVMLASASTAADLHYTLDGSDPTVSSPSVSSGETVSVGTGATLTARAFQPGYLTSLATSAVYTIQPFNPATTVPTPTLTPPGGSFTSPTDVLVEVSTPQATLHYTTDGSEPDIADPTVPSGDYLHVAVSQTLKVRGVRDGYAPSATALGTYFITLGTAGDPDFSPPPGTYSTPQTVTIRADSGVIRYTTDGTDPGLHSPLYNGPVAVGSSMTLKARAYRPGYDPSSNVVTAAYVINAAVAAPVASPARGFYTTYQHVALTSATPGALIHYTMNGAEPDETHPSVASGGVVDVTESGILRARAFLNGNPSTTTREDYALTGAVSVGPTHTLVLKTDGTLWAWGFNRYGEVGNGTVVPQPAPVEVQLADVVAIAAGQEYSLAVTGDGKAWAWGRNHTLQLADGTTAQFQTEPVPVKDGSGSVLTDIVAIEAGATHSFAIRSDGSLWAWGYNGTNALGVGGATGNRPPTQVAVLSSVSSVAAGDTHSLATTSDGALYAWGSNYYGQLGVPGTPAAPTPVPIGGPGPARAVSAGTHSSLAVITEGLSSGGAWGWGRNAFGLLADGSETERPSPGLWGGLSGVLAASGAGDAYTLALRADGSAWAAGRNDNGRLGLGSSGGSIWRAERVSGTGEILEIAEGHSAYHSMAIRSDGAIVAWGDNGSLQLGETGIGFRTIPGLVPGLTVFGATDTWLAEDTDGDGLSNSIELRLGTDPLLVDTNGNGTDDGAETGLGQNALDLDPDQDGLTNAEEMLAGTDPFRADTDGDGTLDGVDEFPLDPTQDTSTNDPNDVTAPDITLLEPAIHEQVQP